jgi:HSP20 family protein
MAQATKLPGKAETQSTPPAAPGWAPFEGLRQEMERLFDRVPGGGWPFGRGAFELALPRLRDVAAGIAPAVDVVEKDGAYEITAELPGMDEKNIDIKLSNGTLTIRGEKKEETEERRKDYFLSERRFGSFMRSFQIPAGVDAEKIDASFAKGVLTVTLPKTAEAQQGEKKIDVKTA